MNDWRYMSGWNYDIMSQPEAWKLINTLTANSPCVFSCHLSVWNIFSLLSVLVQIHPERVTLWFHHQGEKYLGSNKKIQRQCPALQQPMCTLLSLTF